MIVTVALAKSKPTLAQTSQQNMTADMACGFG
jgi:hypothetical protein